MARKDNLIKSKSIYTIRRRHLPLNDRRVIYENDHTTLVRYDGIFNEDVPLFSDSNFKFRIRIGNGDRKKHSRGGWFKDGNGNEVWTLSNLPETKISDESKIILKPKYTSLNDFAYYGSATELIRATVNDVIMRYPGGISFYRGESAPVVYYGGVEYYLVSNQFNIDFWTPVGLSLEGIQNPMRVLAASYMNYEDKDGNDIGLEICITGSCPNSIIGKVSFGNMSFSNSSSHESAGGRRGLKKGGSDGLRGGDDETDGSSDSESGKSDNALITIHTTLLGVALEGASAHITLSSNGSSSRTFEFSGLTDQNGNFYVTVTEVNNVIPGFSELVCEIKVTYLDEAFTDSAIIDKGGYSVSHDFKGNPIVYDYLNINVIDEENNPLSGANVETYAISGETVYKNNVRLSTNTGGTAFIISNLEDSSWYVYGTTGRPQVSVVWKAEATKQGYIQKNASNYVPITNKNYNIVMKADTGTDLICYVYLDSTEHPLRNVNVTFMVDTRKGWTTHSATTDSTGMAKVSTKSNGWVMNGGYYGPPDDDSINWKTQILFYGAEYESTVQIVRNNENSIIIPNFSFLTYVYEDEEETTPVEGASVSNTVYYELNGLSLHRSFNGTTNGRGNTELTLFDIVNSITNYNSILLRWKASASKGSQSDESDMVNIRFGSGESVIKLHIGKVEEPGGNAFDLIIHTLFTDDTPISGASVSFSARTSSGWHYSVTHITNSEGVTTMGLNDTWFDADGDANPEANQNTIFEWRACAKYGSDVNCCRVHGMKELEDTIYFEKEEEDFNYITIRTLFKDLNGRITPVVGAYVTGSTYSAALSPSDTFDNFPGRTDNNGEFFITYRQLCDWYNGGLSEVMCAAYAMHPTTNETKSIPARVVRKTGPTQVENGVFEFVFEEVAGEIELTIQTLYADNSAPIRNVEATFSAYSVSTGLWYYNIEHTDINGIASMSINGPWYHNGVEVVVKPDGLTGWTGYATVDNHTEGGDIKVLPDETLYVMRFPRSTPPTTSWNDLTVIAVDGYVGGPNNHFIPNAPASITVRNSKGAEKTFTGITNSEGKFTKSQEEITSVFGWEVTMWRGSATYTGTTKTSEWQTLGNTSAHKHPSVTLYFYNAQTGTTIPDGNLIATAYTGEQGRMVPCPGVVCTFIVAVDKSCSMFSKTAMTNSNGVAYVNINSGGWTRVAGSGTDDFRYINVWGVTGTTNGASYAGQQSSLGTGICPRCPIEIAKDNDDVIVVPKTCLWDKVSVYTIYESNSSNGINGVPVVIRGRTANGSEFVVNGVTSRQEHPNYHEERDGLYIADRAIRWTKIGGPATDTIADVTGFTVSATHMGEMKTYQKPAVPAADGVIYFTIKFSNHGQVTIPDGCDDMSGTWFYVYLDGNGNMQLLTTSRVNYNDLTIIRPKKKFRDEFWDSLDEFEKVLLNRKTTPIYKAKFDTPFTVANLNFYRLEQYIWPTLDGTTPDVSTVAFQGYLNSLLELAEYHDNYDTNNLWRMMTHESIKNLDWTFRRMNEDEYTDVDFESSRLKSMLMVQGRVYDDLIMYANNVKRSNEITYNENGNVPDYFLTDKLDVGGWEPLNIAPFVSGETRVSYGTEREPSNSGRTDTNDTGNTVTSTPAEVNSAFMRRLVLNTNYIMSMKGTRRGIEAILGMFGYDMVDRQTSTPGEYNITEYIAVANEFPNQIEVSNFIDEIGETESSVESYGRYGAEYDYFPVAIVSTGEEEENYLIPWFRKNHKYFDNLYFQQKGGWGRIKEKLINLSITSATSITEDPEFNLFSETEPYLRFVNTLDDLTSLPSTVAYKNMVCYVTDISNIYDVYTDDPAPNSSITPESMSATTSSHTQSDRGSTTPINHDYQLEPEYEDYSHYFILVNEELSPYLGFVDNERYYCYGWRNIRLSEFEGTQPTTVDGLRVLYLESIIHNDKGNNPHIGRGKYDEGLSYIEAFDTLFGYGLREGRYEWLKKGTAQQRALYNSISSYGFDVNNMVVNNKKCFYFEDGESEIITRAATQIQSSEVNESSVWWASNTYQLVSLDGNDDYSSDDVYYNTFVNPEGGSKKDEAAANSIINVKNLTINFGTAGNRHLEQYIKNIVLPYLIEMIPSTTILRYTFNGVQPQPIVPVTPTIGTNTVEHIVGDLATVESGDTYLVENNTALTR